MHLEEIQTPDKKTQCKDAVTHGAERREVEDYGYVLFFYVIRFSSAGVERRYPGSLAASKAARTDVDRSDKTRRGEGVSGGGVVVFNY